MSLNLRAERKPSPSCFLNRNRLSLNFVTSLACVSMKTGKTEEGGSTWRTRLTTNWGEREQKVIQTVKNRSDREDRAVLISSSGSENVTGVRCPAAGLWTHPVDGNETRQGPNNTTRLLHPAAAPLTSCSFCWSQQEIGSDRRSNRNPQTAVSLAEHADCS